MDVLPNISIKQAAPDKFDDNQIKKFIMFYERLTKHMLKTLTYKADSVIKIDNNHRLKSIKFY